MVGHFSVFKMIFLYTIASRRGCQSRDEKATDEAVAHDPNIGLPRGVVARTAVRDPDRPDVPERRATENGFALPGLMH